MPVTLNRRARGNRGVGFDREIFQIAEHILTAQAAGHLAPKEVAAFLNGNGYCRNNGSAFTETAVRRMLRGGAHLGLPFRLQSRQEAGSRPRSPRRSRDQIWQDMRLAALRAQKRREAKSLSAVAMISNAVSDYEQ